MMALDAVKRDATLSIQAAAKIYNIPATTLRRRRDGHITRRDISVNSKKLTDLEEQTIVRYII